jgi:hypothetical protein
MIPVGSAEAGAGLRMPVALNTETNIRVYDMHRFTLVYIYIYIYISSGTDAQAHTTRL